MLEELKTDSKIVGFKQSIRAVEAGNAAKAFVAMDADVHVTAPFIHACEAKSVPIERCESCKALGSACGIDVGAAVAVLLKAE